MYAIIHVPCGRKGLEGSGTLQVAAGERCGLPCGHLDEPFRWRRALKCGLALQKRGRDVDLKLEIVPLRAILLCFSLLWPVRLLETASVEPENVYLTLFNSS